MLGGEQEKAMKNRSLRGKIGIVGKYGMCYV